MRWWYAFVVLAGCAGGDATGVDEAPTAVIFPLAADAFTDADVRLTGYAVDDVDAPAALAVSWESDVDGILDLPGTPDDDGAVGGAVRLSEGAHVLTLTVEDTAGHTATDTSDVVVTARNAAPGCTFVSPAAAATVAPGAPAALTVRVTDDQDVAGVQVTFASDVDGALGAASVSSGGLASLTTSTLTAGGHVVSAFLADAGGLDCFASVSFLIGSDPTVEVVSPAADDVVNLGEPVMLVANVGSAGYPADDLAVTLASDRDGALSTPHADTAGHLAVPVVGLSRGLHVLTLTATDPAGLDATASVTVRVNGAPDAPAVTVGPDPARSGDGLFAVATASDPEGDPLTYAYAWSRDGVPQAVTGPTVSGADVLRGHTWRVTVTASDAWATGPEGAAQLVVGNRPPEADLVEVRPTDARAGDLLSCAASATDAEGDAVTWTWAWSIDDVPAGTASTLVAPTRGEVVSCTATPHDAGAGTPATSRLTVGNTPPTATGAMIQPAIVRTGDPLTATILGYADVDGDAAATPELTWSREGAPGTWETVGTGPTLSIALPRGARVRVQARPVDVAGGVGTSVTSDVVEVANTPPRVVSVTVAPSAPTVLDSVSCAATAEDADGDPVDLAYAWTTDGQDIGVGTTVDSGYLLRDRVVTCVVTPSDAEPGTPASASVTVVNAPPSITGVELSSLVPAVGDDLVAHVVGYWDPDDDPEGDHDWHWSTAAAAAGPWTAIDVTGATLPLAGYPEGAWFRVEVTPRDAEGAGGVPAISPAAHLAPGAMVDVGLEGGCAIRDAVLWCWGTNTAGGVGDGTTVTAWEPVRISDGWASVDAGTGFACGIRVDGTLWCWGSNTSGQLGDGTAVATSTPEQVGTDADWLQVSAGASHVCGLRTGGELWCWGSNQYGKLGIDTTVDKRQPTLVHTTTGYAFVEAGANHSCAIHTSGAVLCWGYNNKGQLGDGTRVNRLTPFTVVGGGLWREVSAGDDHTCGVRTDGGVWCWGDDTDGQIGDGPAFGDQLDPIEVGGTRDWVSVSAGINHSCAVRADRTLSCWGRNVQGTERNVPYPIDGGGGWTGVSTVSSNTVCLTAGSDVACMGSGSGDNQSVAAMGLGDSIHTTPSPLGHPGVVAVAPGKARITLLDAEGVASNLGKFDYVPRVIQTDVAAVGQGTRHGCQLRVDGRMWCQGTNSSGQLGDGTGVTSEAPVLAGPATDWLTLVTGDDFNCGTRGSGALWCWGANSFGQLGDTTEDNAFDPVIVYTPITEWRMVAAGLRHTCGIAGDGTLWCWGRNFYGEGGFGAVGDHAVPTQVGVETDWEEIGPNGYSTCGIRAGGQLWCWGYNGYGAVGDGTTAHRTSPKRIGTGTDWWRLSSGLGNATCGLRTDGTAWCWGQNAVGMVGDGSTINRTAPTAVVTDRTFTDIRTGDQLVCAVDDDQEAWCWGRSESGEIPYGSYMVRSPIELRFRELAP